MNLFSEHISCALAHSVHRIVDAQTAHQKHASAHLRNSFLKHTSCAHSVHRILPSQGSIQNLDQGVSALGMPGSSNILQEGPWPWSLATQLVKLQFGFRGSVRWKCRGCKTCCTGRITCHQWKSYHSHQWKEYHSHQWAAQLMKLQFRLRKSLCWELYCSLWNCT